MAEKAPQTYENHRRYVPGYHVGVFGVLVLNLLYSLVHLWRGRTPGAVVGLLVAGALVGLFFYTRIFALTVQDRLIRLEMRLRLQQILPNDMKAQIPVLTPDQLIGLRFAGDAEMADLVRDVQTNGIKDREAIKKMVKDWQGDYLRV